MALAGGLAVGDRVICRGLPGTVVGGPARAACNRLSVAVRYDDGRIADERVVGLELLVDDEEEEDERSPYNDGGEDELQPPPMPPPVANLPNQQQAASQAMWAQPADMGTPTPAVFARDADEASPEDSPDSRVPYQDRANGRDERDAPSPVNLEAQGGTAGYGPDEAEEIFREKIYANYEDLRSAFRALDQSNNGFVSKEDFFQAMGRVFLTNGFSEEDVYEVADRFDLNRDGHISFEEFVALVEGDNEQQQEQRDEPAHQVMDDPKTVTAVDLAIQKFKASIDQRYTSTRKAFLALDCDRTSSLSPQNFAQGLTNHGIYLTPPQLELAWSVFDRNGIGQISYGDFCAVMTQRLQFGAHLSRQMFM